MVVRFNFDDEELYAFCCSDVAGLIAAVKESETIHFGTTAYKFDSILLNHYKEDGDSEMRQELMIYLKE